MIEPTVTISLSHYNDLLQQKELFSKALQQDYFIIKGLPLANFTSFVVKNQKREDLIEMLEKRIENLENKK
jgi:hypothetical protein